jgi:hypothetical protein
MFDGTEILFSRILKHLTPYSTVRNVTLRGRWYVLHTKTIVVSVMKNGWSMGK